MPANVNLVSGALKQKKDTATSLRAKLKHAVCESKLKKCHPTSGQRGTTWSQPFFNCVFIPATIRQVSGMDTE
jgi:hypothetical protein